MSDYAVITENDESPWEDIKGEVYRFPNTYRKILTTGCRVIYYTSRMIDKKYTGSRLSPEPHYFGIGEIGKIVDDPLSSKGDLFCEINNYREFTEPRYILAEDMYFHDAISMSKATDTQETIKENRSGTICRYLENTHHIVVGTPKHCKAYFEVDQGSCLINCVNSSISCPRVHRN